MAILYAHSISLVITSLTYLLLLIFICVSVQFYTKPLREGPYYYPTISELVDDRATNGYIYLIFVTLYGTVKTILIGISLLDPHVLHQELVERRTGIDKSTPKSRELFVFVSNITGLLGIVQVICMIILVLFPVSTRYLAHVTVAAFAFCAALLKSLFLLIRRKLLYSLFSPFYLLNLAYFIAFSLAFLVFYLTRYGFVEYILVSLILFENVLLAREFCNLTLEFTVTVDDTANCTEPVSKTQTVFKDPLEHMRLLDKWFLDTI